MLATPMPLLEAGLPLDAYVGAWVAAFLTLAIFSFLYGDNPVYKFAEHLYVGVAAGYYTARQFADTIIPNLVIEVTGRDIDYAASGWSFVRKGDPNLWRLGALVLSLMLLLRLFKSTSWVSRWPLAFMIGAFAAVKMTGMTESDLVQQVQGTVVPIYAKAASVPADSGFVPPDAEAMPVFARKGPSVVNHLVIVFGTIAVLGYFFFSVEHKGVVGAISRTGIYFLMITFGAAFGQTVLGRVSLLIGRSQDLMKFSSARYHYATFVCALLVVGLLALHRALGPKPGGSKEGPAAAPEA